ncbi:MAG: class I SAM-dependent methyltransferase [Nitrospiraceae bacterium]|nr:class I SAM-dependent methyltransferase [Nitrospiraceae bacterium]
MILYPIPERRPTTIEQISSKCGSVGICTACGRIAYFRRYLDNHRELGNCLFCGASNRKRQICYLLRKELKSGDIGKIITSASILNAESSGGLHNSLKHNTNYISSEYFGDAYRSGEMVNGTLHVNLLDTHFDDNKFDFVLTSDVLEHIPDPYKAFREIYRILRPGGVHIFTVPFYQTHYFDEKRAEIIDSQIIHHMEPIYHLDPNNPNGILVYNIFSIEMLLNLSRIGYRTIMHKLYAFRYGIFGNNAIIFESRKI